MLRSGMSTVEHYRDQAAQCRQLAAEEAGSKHAERWLLIARNYDVMAVALQKRHSAKLERVLKNARAAADRQPNG
jgi:hypothetical protein